MSHWEHYYEMSHFEWKVSVLKSVKKLQFSVETIIKADDAGHRKFKTDNPVI